MSELPLVIPGEGIDAVTFGNPVLARVISRYTNAAERDTKVPSPTSGDVAFLLDSDAFQIYNGSAWVPFISADGVRSMSGALNMANHKVLNVALGTEASDGIRRSQAVLRDDVDGTSSSDVQIDTINTSGWETILTDTISSTLGEPAFLVVNAYASLRRTTSSGPPTDTLMRITADDGSVPVSSTPSIATAALDVGFVFLGNSAVLTIGAATQGLELRLEVQNTGANTTDIQWTRAHMDALILTR